MKVPRKPLFWLDGEIKSPPFSVEARVEAGFLLGRVQEGVLLSNPQSKPMTTIGPRCHEIRVRDRNRTWRIIYRIDADAILVVAVFDKTTRKTELHDIRDCKSRLKKHDQAIRDAEKRSKP